MSKSKGYVFRPKPAYKSPAFGRAIFYWFYCTRCVKRLRLARVQVTLFGVAQQSFVSRDEGETVFSGGGDQKAVGGITVNFAGQACGLDEDAVRQGKYLETIRTFGVYYEVIDGLAKLDSAFDREPSDFQHRDRRQKESTFHLRSGEGVARYGADLHRIALLKPNPVVRVEK